MKTKGKPLKPAQRVARHRKARSRSGLRRLEITVPERDVATLRAIADRLRNGGETANQVRQRLEPLGQSAPQLTGWALVEALRMPPGFGTDDLDLTREMVPLREIDLE